MTTEEKARAYDEALKVIKECNPDENGFITIYPQEIFSELKESEDERIRKAILSGMKFLSGIQGRETFGGIPIHKCIAWLKKQTEPKWSDEDKRICYSLLADIKARQKDGTSTLEAYYNEQINWLKSLKERMI